VFKEINNWFTDFYTFSEFSVKIVQKKTAMVLMEIRLRDAGVKHGAI